MRLGQNPLKAGKIPEKPKIDFLVITHLPNEEGYHEHRMEVVKLCLLSMRDNSNVDANIIVWDNDSCLRLKNWLEMSYKPNTLIFSENVGKAQARASVISMLPVDHIINVSDDDMYYYPNWFLPQQEILQVYPNVACVSGYPNRSSFRWGNKHTLAWAFKNAAIEEGRFISDKEEYDFSISIGRDPAIHKSMLAQEIDYRITYRGLRAYATSHHAQQIGYVNALAQAQYYDGMYLGPERSYDNHLDELGLRLCTIKTFVRHIGNIVDENMLKDLEDIHEKALSCLR